MSNILHQGKPSDQDWSVLFNYIDPDANGAFAGCKMKSAGVLYWSTPNFQATNETGFSFLPAGNRDNYNGFGEINSVGELWSSTEYDSSTAITRFVDYISNSIQDNDQNKESGYPVRCLAD